MTENSPIPKKLRSDADEVMDRLSQLTGDPERAIVLWRGDKVFAEESVTIDNDEQLGLDRPHAPIEPWHATLVIDLGKTGVSHKVARPLAGIQADMDAHPDAPWRGPSQLPKTA